MKGWPRTPDGRLRCAAYPPLVNCSNPAPYRGGLCHPCRQRMLADKRAWEADPIDDEPFPDIWTKRSGPERSDTCGRGHVQDPRWKRCRVCRRDAKRAERAHAQLRASTLPRPG